MYYIETINVFDSPLFYNFKTNKLQSRLTDNCLTKDFFIAQLYMLVRKHITYNTRIYTIIDIDVD